MSFLRLVIEALTLRNPLLYAFQVSQTKTQPSVLNGKYSSTIARYKGSATRYMQRNVNHARLCCIQNQGGKSNCEVFSPKQQQEIFVEMTTQRWHAPLWVRRFVMAFRFRLDYLDIQPAIYFLGYASSLSNVFEQGLALCITPSRCRLDLDALSLSPGLNTTSRRLPGSLGQHIFCLPFIYAIGVP